MNVRRLMLLVGGCLALASLLGGCIVEAEDDYDEDVATVEFSQNEGTKGTGESESGSRETTAKDSNEKLSKIEKKSDPDPDPWHLGTGEGQGQGNGDEDPD